MVTNKHATLKKLQEKHPCEKKEFPKEQLFEPITLKEGIVLKAILLMASTSAPGPDELQISHLRQMLSEEVGEEVSRLSQFLICSRRL